MRKEYKQRLANEYRYAAERMREEKEPARKLFYFSVFFGEAQRVLNWEWDKDLALIYMVTRQVHNQVNQMTQSPALMMLPINGAAVNEKLTEAAGDLASIFEKPHASKEELYSILSQLSEIAYIVTGNGSYLYEKGMITF